MTDNGKFTCKFIIAVAGFIVLKRFCFRGNQHEITQKKFKKIVRVLQSELPYKLQEMNNEAYEFKCSKSLEITNFDGFNELIRFKLRFLNEYIKEVCLYYEVDFDEFVKIFNGLDNDFISAIVGKSLKQCRSRYTWTKKFTVGKYVELLRNYCEIIEEFKQSKNYMEFMKNETLLYEDVWRKYRVNQAILKGAHYKYRFHQKVVKYIKKIHLLMDTVVFEPSDLPSI